MFEKNYASGKSFLKLSQEEISDIRNQDMVEFLRSQEGFSFKRVGSYVKGVEHDSLVINPDHITWHWYSRELYGKGAIDWMEKVHDLDFKEAIRYLAEGIPHILNEEPIKKPQLQENETAAFELPTKLNGSCKQLFAYLIKTRCLPPDIVTYCVQQHHIYQDEKNRVIFCGRDKSGECKFAEAKFTYTYQKYYPQNIAGSNKRYSFFIPAQHGCANYTPETICVFEAPIDLLSHGALMQMVAKKQLENMGRGNEYRSDCWLSVNRVSLSGVSDLALSQRLEDNPQIKNIVLCLDNDEKGQQACQRIMDKYKDRYRIRISKPPCGKDWNDTLKATVKNPLNASKGKSMNFLKK